MYFWPQVNELLTVHILFLQAVTSTVKTGAFLRVNISSGQHVKAILLDSTNLHVFDFNNKCS